MLRPTLSFIIAVLPVVLACEAPPTAKPSTEVKPAVSAKAKTDEPPPVIKKLEPPKVVEPAASIDPNAPPLMNPAKATETAPDKFKVKFVTTKGDVLVEVDRAWAPKGADRFYNLVKIGYFTDVAFFRNVPKFMVQFGIHGDSKVNDAWRMARIDDDTPKESNKRGFVTFATSGPNSRTVQMFINHGDNTMLDSQGFAPFGKVVKGMEVVDKLYDGYGEGAPRGQGPNQMLIQSQGNAYLKKDFPKLDYVKKAEIVK